MIPDAEKTAVAWARADAAIAALIGTRCATRLPKDWESPFLRVVMIDGGTGYEDEVADALLQWDAYAFDPAKHEPDFPNASTLARTLVQQAQAWQGGAIGGAHLYSFGNISGPRRIEENETGWARYMVETTVSARLLVGGS